MFLESAARAEPKVPLSLDTKDMEKESRRIFGSLRDLFAKMEGLARAYKKSDPARYAAEMSELKEELVALLKAAKTLLKDSDVALQQLFNLVRDERNPSVKESMSFLLRFADSERAAPYAIALAESENTADRKVAIDTLALLRTENSAQALIKRAAAEDDKEVRQRAILGLGKLVSRPSGDYKDFKTATFDAIRQYTQPSNEPYVREAAWGALAYVPNLAPEDQDRIVTALRAEKDPVVRKSVENAWRHMNIQSKKRADVFKPNVAPR
jgi:HEAT repeat protein